MRLLLVLSGLATAMASTGSGFTTPIIVDSLQAHRKAADAAKNRPPLQEPNPLPYPLPNGHKWTPDMDALQGQIEAHDNAMKQLQSDLQKALAHKHRLLQAQKLFHSMVSLHQSQVVLSQIDAKIQSIKEECKKIGEQVDELVRDRDALKNDLKSAMSEHSDKIRAIKKKLEDLAKVLSQFQAKRGEVAGIVAEWRAHVDHLRGAHGLPTQNGLTALSIPVLPHPPSEDEEAQAAELEQAKEAESSPSSLQEEEKAMEAEQEATTMEMDAPAAEVTVTPKDIADSHASIQELVGVHLPRITGAINRFAKHTTSFLETTAAAWDAAEASP